MVFVFGSVYVMDYVYRLAYVEPALHPWNKACFIMMDKHFDVLLQLVCQYLTEDLASMFIMDIGMKFYFFVKSVRFWYQDDAGLIK